MESAKEMMNIQASQFDFEKTALFRSKRTVNADFSIKGRVFIMQNVIEDIRRGIDEIRNLLGPMSLKLQNLDHKITESKISFELRTSEFDARIETNALKISEQAIKSHEHSRQIASLFERVQWMEACLNVPRRPEKEARETEESNQGQEDVRSE